MNKLLLQAPLMAMLASTTVFADSKVYDESSFIEAIDYANADNSIEHIIFEKNVHISLTSPIIYTGSQDIEFIGNNATIDGASAGSFTLDNDLTAVTEDGTIMFNTAANIRIQRLSVVNSATRGIVVNIPESAQGEDIHVSLHKVHITDTALYGLHIDDNADEFDDGISGSDIGIELNISYSSFTGNGTGAIDFDGVRVDERGLGDITAVIKHTHIDANGGDGIELDEGGDGSVYATMRHVTLNGNGFYDAEDLDDGFDIDEVGAGDVVVTLVNVEVKHNQDEGLDFDEAGEGSVELKLYNVVAMDNADEGIKVDEEEAGDIDAKLTKVMVMASGDDGIQFTELGEGTIEAKLKKVSAIDNKKYGIKMEQWVEEDEATIIEDAGELKLKKVTLSDNGKGDELKLNNIDVQ